MGFLKDLYKVRGESCFGVRFVSGTSCRSCSFAQQMTSYVYLGHFSLVLYFRDYPHKLGSQLQFVCANQSILNFGLNNFTRFCYIFHPSLKKSREIVSNLITDGPTVSRDKLPSFLSSKKSREIVWLWECDFICYWPYFALIHVQHMFLSVPPGIVIAVHCNCIMKSLAF